LQQTIAQVDLNAIAYNVTGVQEKVKPAGVMAVVKANAYGHGAVAVSRTALARGCQYLAVARVAEAIELRKAGIEAPILILGGFGSDEVFFIPRYDLEATIFDEQDLLQLANAARKAETIVPVHIKLDTGMGRVGLPWQEVLAFAQKVQSCPSLKLQGLYSHFATADGLDKSYAELQLERFKMAVAQLQGAGIPIPIKHIANSAAILDLPESYFDMVRPGIILYGYYPSSQTTESIPLRPAMTFKTQVLQVKTIERGDSVSYERTFIAQHRTRIATLPVGYADGYNRLLSNRGQVLIRGHRYPVVGRVCMDFILVNLGLDDQVQAGDEAILFGRQGDEWITVASWCETLQTIPYEVTCWIAQRVPRLYLPCREE